MTILSRGVAAAVRRLAPVAALFLGAAPAGAQDSDDYGVLSAEIDARGAVAVLATGWHPVVGNEAGVAAAGEGGVVAITGDAFVENVSARGRVSAVRRYDYLPAVAMTADADALAAAKDYDSGVRVWKDWPVKIMLADSIGMVGADRARGGGYTGEGVYIAVIDTGVDVEHPFIAGRDILQACFADRCPNERGRMTGEGAARPVNAHGTHVAGIALGRGEDVAGVAPGAGLIAINVFNPDGGARNSNILAALDWLVGLARTERFDIASANMSLGVARHFSSPCPDRLYELAARLLARHGVVIVAAAGNESRADGIAHPACVRNIVSVGAIDKNFDVADFSNSAPILDLLAPGVAIGSSVPRSEGSDAPFREYPGTSMAAPHIAGAFAVLKQAAPERSHEELFRSLIANGRDVRDPRSGIVKPALDLARALSAVGAGMNDEPPPPPPGAGADDALEKKEDEGWRAIGG